MLEWRLPSSEEIKLIKAVRKDQYMTILHLYVLIAVSLALYAVIIDDVHFFMNLPSHNISDMFRCFKLTVLILLSTVPIMIAFKYTYIYMSRYCTVCDTFVKYKYESTLTVLIPNDKQNENPKEIDIKIQPDIADDVNPYDSVLILNQSHSIFQHKILAVKT